jgi:uncharacterized protein YcnI
VVLVAALLGTMVLAGRAAAHVEVTAEPAQAGAKDAVVTFAAEAESAAAGIRSIQVQLPAGIAPADVTLQSAPPGWSLAATADGYTVSGPPLAVGVAARYAIRVRQLPDVPTVAFKTLQNYTDGQTDRWLELPTAGGTEPDNPAPLLTLAAAAPAATTTTTTTATTAPVSSTPAGQAQPVPTSSDSGGLPAWAWVGLAVLVVAALAGGVLLLRRHSGAKT